MSGSMNIGEAAQAAGVSAKMIRHYEQIGLVPPALRTEAGYRRYSERDVSILRFIRQSRQLGFSIEQIAGLLGLWSDSHRSSREVKALAQAHLADLERKLGELAQMRDALKRLVDACSGDDDPHCAILETLATGSPQAPAAGVVGPHTVHRGVAAGHAVKAAGGGTGSHLDLMAWTHRGHSTG